MSGFLIMYDGTIPILEPDSLLNDLAERSSKLNRGGNALIQLIMDQHPKMVYISDKDTFNKIKELYNAKESKLIAELYHTLKAEESITDRNRRLEELNNIYKSGKGESIKE